MIRNRLKVAVRRYHTHLDGHISSYSFLSLYDCPSKNACGRLSACGTFLRFPIHNSQWYKELRNLLWMGNRESVSASAQKFHHQSFSLATAQHKRYKEKEEQHWAVARKWWWNFWRLTLYFLLCTGPHHIKNKRRKELTVVRYHKKKISRAACQRL